jgi:hypothetical protein
MKRILSNTNLKFNINPIFYWFQSTYGNHFLKLTFLKREIFNLLFSKNIKLLNLKIASYNNKNLIKKKFCRA